MNWSRKTLYCIVGDVDYKIKRCQILCGVLTFNWRLTMDMEHSDGTAKRAVAFGQGAEKLGFKNKPIIMMNFESHGDTMVYFLANQSSMVVVYCCSNCYLVTYGEKDKLNKNDANYLIVKSLGSFLKNLKKENFDFVTQEEIRDLERRFKINKGQVAEESNDDDEDD
jgi:hypothetical protein